MSRSVKMIVRFAVIFILFIITLWLIVPIFHFYIVKKVFDYVVQNFVNVSGMSTWLAKGVTIFLMIPLVWAILEVTRINFRLFKKRKSYRKLGIFIIIFYVGIFFLSMFFLSQGTYFGHTKGEVTKYYAITPEGIRFFDSPGFDPKYGSELKPVTPKMIEQYERAKRGMKPRPIDTSKEIKFFNSITGESKVWYYRDNEGNYEFFNQSGFHPITSIKFKPVTPEIVQLYQKRFKEIQEQKAHQKIKAKKLLIEKEKIELILREKEETAQKAEKARRKTQARHEFEKLILQEAFVDDWKVKDKWKRKIKGKYIIIFYTEPTKQITARIVHRFQKLGAKVDYKFALNTSNDKHEGNLFYSFDDLEVAIAIQATIVDILNISLNSIGRSGNITLWIE